MEPIIPTGTEFYCKDNGKENHTDMYDLVDSESSFPVLRRGCSFYFAIRFDRDYNPNQDVVRVRFAIGNLSLLLHKQLCDFFLYLGPKPNVVKGTRVILPVRPKHKRLLNDSSRWSICLSKVEGSIITVQVRVSVHAPIGIWKCSLQTNIAGQKEQRFDYEVNLVTLTFNQ